MFYATRSTVFLRLFVVYMQDDKELLDPRGRTPLHLAVSLGYVDCVKCLLRGGCDANAINKDGWNGRKLKRCLKVHGRWEFFVGLLDSGAYTPAS